MEKCVSKFPLKVTNQNGSISSLSHIVVIASLFSHQLPTSNFVFGHKLKKALIFHFHPCTLAPFSTPHRHEFGSDVVIDIVSYRKNGHNEIDEPMFTQPLMYKRVAKMKTAMAKYGEQLIADGVVKQEEYNEEITRYDKILEQSMEAGKSISQVS